MKTTFNTAYARRSGFLIALATLTLMPNFAFSQWVFVARHAIGRIEQVTQNQPAPNQPPTEVVTVILDAPAQRVFNVALNTIQKNQNVNLVSSDPQKMTLKISQDDQMATLSIQSLSDDTAQLIIVGTAVPGQSPQTTRIVDGVMRLCGELQKSCQLASQR
jgi:hypothetical protein